MQTCDVDYRTAYEAVGRAVRSAQSAGLRGIDLTGELLDAAAAELAGGPIGLTGRDLTEVLDPRRIVETRTAAGGAAPTVVEGMAAACAAEAEAFGVLAAQRRGAFRTAERALVERAAALTQGTFGAESPDGPG